MWYGICAVTGRAFPLIKGFDSAERFACGDYPAVLLMTFTEMLEEAVGRQVQNNTLLTQLGGVVKMLADVSTPERDLGSRSTETLGERLRRLGMWHREHGSAAPFSVMEHRP